MDKSSCSLISRVDEGDDEVQLAQKIAKDDHSDNDDGGDLDELLAAALKDKRGCDALSILEKYPHLIQIADPMGDTVIHVAARAGNEWAVCELISFIKKRQDLELKKLLMDTNVNGDTALHLALQKGLETVAYHLVIAEEEAGAIVNNDGMTPFKLARKGGYSQVSKLLSYRHGGFTPLHSARPQCSVIQSFKIISKRIGLADIIMRAVKKDLMGGSSGIGINWAQLYAAIKRSHDDVVVTRLIRERDSKALLWHQDQMGETLLHSAVKAVDPDREGPLEELVYFMISNNLTDAAVFGNKDGDTALHLAVQKEYLTAILSLIKAAPWTMYQVNHKGESPLYLVIKRGNLHLLKKMFKMVTESCLPAYGTEILVNPKNATLLHLAIKARSLGTLETLMEHLPELIKATDEKGWRPLSYAANKGYLDEVTYLLTNFTKSATKYDKDGSLPIHKAVGAGHVSIIQAFLEHCPETLRHIDKKGRSILHIAVRYAKADILAYITKEFKMDDLLLNLRDNEGKTFMDYAN